MNQKGIILLISIILILIIIVMFFVIQKVEKEKEEQELDIKVTGSGNIKIACVGDSITYGIGVKDNREKAWPSLLANLLGEEYQTINYGITRRAVTSTSNFPYNESDIAKKFWKSKEDIILFMLGTNDSKPINWNKKLFEKEYQEMIQKLKDKKEKIYILLPPVVYEDTKKEERPDNNRLEKEIIPSILKVAKEEQVEVIDLHTLTKNHSEWFDDGLHPNEEGNEIIAKEIARILKQENDK